VLRATETGERRSTWPAALLALIYQSTLGPAPPLMAAFAQHIPVRLHLDQFVPHVGEQTAKARCDSVKRCSGLSRERCVGPNCARALRPA
jgi:hypothetical protein